MPRLANEFEGCSEGTGVAVDESGGFTYGGMYRLMPDTLPDELIPPDSLC